MFGEKYGYTFSAVTILMDKKKNLPAGIVQCDIISSMMIDENNEPSFDINTCISSLQGELCGGRPVRIQNAANDTRRLSGAFGKQDASRYFDLDISVKCQLCGLVGHKQNDCTNDPIPNPCHLCAGRDHEASKNGLYLLYSLYFRFSI